MNIVTPKGKPGAGDGDGYFDYASIDGQKKLVALHEAVEASAWIEEDSANAWYPMLREWIYECGREVTFDDGPMVNQTCIKRDCVWPETVAGFPYPFNGSLIYEYCTHKKNLRDEGGNTVEVTENFFGSELSRDVPGAAEEKYLVLADGTRAPTTPTRPKSTFRRATSGRGSTSSSRTRRLAAPSRARSCGSTTRRRAPRRWWRSA